MPITASTASRTTRPSRSPRQRRSCKPRSLSLGSISLLITPQSYCLDAYRVVPEDDHRRIGCIDSIVHPLSHPYIVLIDLISLGSPRLYLKNGSRFECVIPCRRRENRFHVSESWPFFFENLAKLCPGMLWSILADLGLRLLCYGLILLDIAL
jgi:hypothetical protein